MCLFGFRKRNICLLQETYWTNEILNKLQKEQDVKLLSKFGTQHSKGTAILLKNNYEVINIHKTVEFYR